MVKDIYIWKLLALQTKQTDFKELQIISSQTSRQHVDYVENQSCMKQFVACSVKVTEKIIQKDEY